MCGPGSDADDGPYFLLSHAHAIRDNDLDADDQDIWVPKLFHDLCGHIGEIEGLPLIWPPPSRRFP